MNFDVKFSNIRSNNIFISVIIPTYRPKAYLNDCLESIKRQSLVKDIFEVIVVLNGCDEPYLSEILLLLKTEFDLLNICLIHTHDSGVSNARNIGIERSKGQYIIFIDDDDIISDNYIEELYNNATPQSICCSNIKTFKKQIADYSEDHVFTKDFKRLTHNGIKSTFDCRRMLNGPWMKIFPKDLIRNTRFKNDIPLGEDALFCFEVSLKAKDITLTDSSAIYYYRLRDGGAFASKRSISELLNIVRKLLWNYISIYINNHVHGNFLFFTSRIIAVMLLIPKLLIKYNHNRD